VNSARLAGRHRLVRAGVALAVAALAATVLSACQSKVGTAAYVGSTRITESTVGSYVDRDAAVTTDSSSGQVDNPKAEVLTTLVRTAIVDQIFKTLPGNHPTASELDAARTSVLSQLGISSVTALENQAKPAGFTTAYATAFIDEQAKIIALTADLKDPGDGTAVAKAIAKQHLKISVSPRYGVWDPSQLTVGSSPSLPSFLTTASSTRPTQRWRHCCGPSR
jgi:hypothetical protein